MKKNDVYWYDKEYGKAKKYHVYIQKAQWKKHDYNKNKYIMQGLCTIHLKKRF